MTYQPSPGEFFVTRGPGFVDHAIRWFTRSKVNHAGVYVGNGKVVEAAAKGAILSPVSGYLHDDAKHHTLWAGPALTDGHGADIAAKAKGLLGTPYNFVDIACIALSCIFGGHRLPKFIRRRIERPDRLICSGLVDYAYYLGGVQLFNDGRLFNDVTPEDLAELIPGYKPDYVG